MSTSMPSSMDSPEREESAAAGLPSPAPVLNYRRPSPRRALPEQASVKAVLALALPAIVEQVLNAVIGLTDTLIAGHIAGGPETVAAASAAVGLMTYLQWFCGLMTAAIGVGATAIVARAIGARRVRVANRVVGTALTAAFLVGVVLSITLFLLAPQVIAFCKLEGQAAAFATAYLRIMVITVSLQTAGQIGMACLRGAGDTVSPMAIMTLVMLVNGLFSTCLTYGWLGMPAWGISGNATGTLLAYFTGGVCTLALLLSGRGGLKLRRNHLTIVPHILQRILRIGLPSWLEGVLLWGGQFLVILLVINQKSGDGVMLAAHNAVLRIESISFLPGFGFGIAASAMVGQYLGAQKPHEAKRAATIALWLGFATMTVLALPMVLFPGPLLRVLVNSAPVIDTGLWPMVLAGIAQPGFSIAIVLSGALKGAGETLWPMAATLTGVFVVRIPLVILMCLSVWHWGLTGVWVAIVVDLAYRAAVNAGIFATGRWQTKKV